MLDFDIDGVIGVNNDVAKEIHKIAAEQDINDGGYFDNRLGAINLYCGPEDKPQDYNGVITKGVLNYPRNYVGIISFNYIAEDKWHIVLDLDTTFPNEKEWCLGKMSYLVREAHNRLYPHKGIKI